MVEMMRRSLGRKEVRGEGGEDAEAGGHLVELEAQIMRVWWRRGEMGRRKKT